MVEVGRSWRRLKMGDRLRDIFRSQPVVDGPPGSSRVALVLLLSGFLGFCLGLSYSSWQVAVEPAQVVAGIVHYPRQNPNYVYQVKIWTILHQICALLLHFGVSEKTLSLFLSGLAGMVSFQALALCVLALSDDSVLAIVSPFFISFARLGTSGGIIYAGVTYPVMLMGYTHTYGMLGLSFILLVAALIGVGQYKLGGFLLGIAPALHPSLGAWFSLAVLICLIWDFRFLSNAFRRSGKYVLLGYSVSAISLAFHLLVTYDAPPIAPDAASEYLSTFVRYWGSHRRPFSLFSPSILVVILSLLMSLLWLLHLKRDVPRNSLFLLRSFVVAGLIGGVLSISYWLPPEEVPNVLLMMMPARLLNLNALGLMALLIGLLGRYKDNFWVQLNLTALVVMMLLRPGFPRIYAYMLVSGLSLILSVSNPKKPYQRFAFVLGGLLPIVMVLSPPIFPGYAYMVPSGLFLILSVSNLKKPYQRLVFVLGGLLPIMGGLALLSGKSQNPIFFGRYSWIRLLAASLLFTTAALVLLLSGSLSNKGISPYISRLLGKLSICLPSFSLETLLEDPAGPSVLRKMTFFVLGLMVIVTVIRRYPTWQGKINGFRDWTNDPLFAEASRGQGMLLTSSSLGLIQLRTRRPVLLDGHALDTLPYAPETGPEMDRILQQVYGVDFFNPPEEIERRRPAALLPHTGKALWESRTPEQWDQIRKQFGVTEVMTYAGWKLKLPEVMRNGELVLYRIPGQ